MRRTAKQLLDDRDLYATISGGFMISGEKAKAAVALLQAQCCYAAATGVVRTGVYKEVGL